MTTLHGLKINVGDKVWDSRFGWSEVISIYNRKMYEIETNFNCYMSDGKYHIEDKFPTLFWNEFEAPEGAFIKPLPKLRVDTKVLVWNDGDTVKLKRHFSHFYDDEIYCFINGVTGWTTKNAITTSWDNWELYKEEVND
jgi:hypothetical protein